MAYFKNIDRYGEEQYNGGLWVDATTNPDSTGNTGELPRHVNNTVTGEKWFIDALGVAKLLGSAPFKNQNEFHVDPLGDDSGDGSQENPYKTITKALSMAGQGDQVIVHAGVYAENITMSTPNVSLVGAQSDYFSLTQIQGTVTVSATGTSVRISDVLVNGAITHSGAADLYLNNVAITSTLTSSSAGYLEVRNSSIQDDTITKSAGTMLIENSKIEDVSITGANTAVVVRDAYQEGGSTITFGAGTVYGINNVQGGEIVINGAAIPLETAALAQGLSAEMAKEAETADFQKLGMLRPDLEATPTKVVTWDEVTKRLEVSDLSAIASAPSVTFGTATPPTGGTPKEGDEYFRTSTGTSTGEVTEQWIYDATTSSWIKRPSSVSYKTTSLTPVYGTGTAYVGASNTALATVADQMRLSDGSIVDDVDVTWTGHGLTVHAWYYLDAATGGYTSTKPTSGFIQQLFFVKDANTIHIDIEQAAEVQTASAVTTTVTYGTAAPPRTAATGSEYFITSTGTTGGTITASYVFDGTTWVLRPSSSGGGTVTAKVTTSLVVQYGNGSSHVNALATAATTVADVIKLSDGSLVNNEDIVTWTSHGLTLHAWYFLSDTVAGGYTTTPPLAPNYSQRLFYIVDANTVKINVQEAVLGYDATSGAGGQFWSINSAIGTEIAVDNFTLRVAPTGNVALQIKANTGTLSMQGQGQIITNATITPYGYNAASVTTTYSYFSTSVNATAVPWGEFIYLHDNTNDRTYEVRMQRRTSSGVTPVVCVITVIRLR